jgi:hypothetical protein
LLFVTAKPQNAPLGLLLAAYSARLAWLRGERRWRTASAAIAMAVVAASAVYYAMTPRKLVVLSPELKKYARTHPYMPAVPFYGPELRQAFFDHMNYGKILGFFAMHPDRLWSLLNRCAPLALWLRPRHLANLEKSAGRGPTAQSERFDWWSRIHQSVYPASMRGLLLFFGVNGAVAAALYRRRRGLKDRLYLELFGALIVMAGLQFLMVALSEGTIDVIKHMFLFSLLFDLVLAMALVWLAGLAAASLQRFRSAAPAS